MSAPLPAEGCDGCAFDKPLDTPTSLGKRSICDAPGDAYMRGLDWRVTHTEDDAARTPRPGAPTCPVRAPAPPKEP